MSLSLFWSHALLISFTIYLLAFHPALGNAKKYVDRESKGVKRRPTKRKLNELLSTEIARSGNIRLDNVFNILEITKPLTTA